MSPAPAWAVETGQVSQSPRQAQSSLAVVCAFPVSGQYGPGTRTLFYVLIATCILARKVTWLRDEAVLNAGYLIPVVAALHGIVLAGVHVDGAVDLDVYGALQFAVIGILAFPLTVGMSRFSHQYRTSNIIFIWMGIMFAGTICLIVELYRISPSQCSYDASVGPIPSNPSAFPYTGNITCGMTCSVDEGPFSPLRGGASNNIYVVPAPTKLTPGTAMLLTSAACISSLLRIITLWNRIMYISWAAQFGRADDDETSKIEATGRMFLRALEVPFFLGATIAMIVLGEINFGTRQMAFQTEPMASVGQWSPIVGVGLAALGALYIFVSHDTESSPEPQSKTSVSVHGTQSPSRPLITTSTHGKSQYKLQPLMRFSGQEPRFIQNRKARSHTM